MASRSHAGARPHRVLVLAPTARDAGIARDVLGGAHVDAEACPDMAAVAAGIDEGVGAVIVTEEAVARDREGLLAAAVERQPRWSDLPILVLTRGEEPSAGARGALDRLGNVTLIDRPVRLATLVSAVRTALRGRERQYQLRQHLEERERSEAALAASEERYRAIGETIPYGAWVADAQGRFQYVSDAFLRLLGIDMDEVHARGWHHRLPTEDRERAAADWRRAIAGGAMFDHELRVVGAEGENRVVLVRGVALRDAEGRIGSWVGMHLDVTEKRQIEEEMARIGRLDSVALLAGGIAHDFNNILTAIVGNLSLALRRATPGDPVVTRIEQALRACGQAQTLARQLLTFAKGGAPVRQTLHVEGPLRDAAAFAAQGSGVLVDVRLPAQLWPVHADPGQIGQVVHNLVLNAVQAMGGTGTVRVAAANAEIATGSVLPLPPGRYVQVSVTDTGRGIPASDLPRVFDLFFTGRSGGSGLGLATVHSIVQRHGGHVTVRSEPGVGSTFTFWLPVSEVPVETPAPVAPREEPVRERARVLVMDDDAGIRDVAREALSYLGYDVDLATDGAQAIERYAAARDAGRPYDVVVLDLTVPGGMGGRETIARLHALDPDVRAIVASGYSNDPVMSSFRAYGFLASVDKPYGVEELAAVVERVVGTRG